MHYYLIKFVSGEKMTEKCWVCGRTAQEVSRDVEKLDIRMAQVPPWGYEEDSKTPTTPVPVTMLHYDYNISVCSVCSCIMNIIADSKI